MAPADSPPTAVEPSDEQRSTGASGTRGWRKVVALWATAVGAQAVILLVLTQYGNILSKSRDLEGVARLLAEGRVQDAKGLATWSFQAPFPTEILLQYALLGVAVILLAWVGRRPLALALPFLIGIASMSPTFSGVGSMSPKPLSDFNDAWLWQILQLGPTGSVIPEIWPALLGLAVQTGLLLLPVIAAPHRRATTSLASAARDAAVPTLTVMVLALATLEYSTVTELYWMPAIALTIGLLSSAIVTGTGSAWVRFPAAVGVPTLLGAIVMPFDYASNSTTSTAGLTVAAAALLITLGTIAVPRTRCRLHALQQPRVPEVPATV